MGKAKMCLLFTGSLSKTKELALFKCVSYSIVHKSVSQIIKI
jgi:hypothetical protein